MGFGVDGSGATGGGILRSYVWGLDNNGSLTGANTPGSLLQLTNYTGGTPGASYLPTYERNPTGSGGQSDGVWPLGATKDLVAEIDGSGATGGGNPTGSGR